MCPPFIYLVNRHNYTTYGSENSQVVHEYECAIPKLNAWYAFSCLLHYKVHCKLP
jgi:hypothetical protein